MIPSRYSFRLLSRAEIKKIRLDLKSKNNYFGDSESNLYQTEPSEGSKKRLFLKMAGVVGLGAVASLLLPKKAQALVFGSTPAANVVGVKDADNLRITPAKTGQLPESLTATTNYLKVAILEGAADGVAGANVGLKNSLEARINPATQDTLATLATDENLLLLRRITKQLESLSTVDSSTRQRVTVEGATITSGTITTVSSVTAVASVTAFGASATLPSLTALGGVDARYLYIDTARNSYANGIRNNL